MIKSNLKRNSSSKMRAFSLFSVTFNNIHYNYFVITRISYIQISEGSTVFFNKFSYNIVQNMLIYNTVTV